MVNVKLLAVAAPSSIYLGYCNQKMFWEECSGRKVFKSGKVVLSCEHEKLLSSQC